MAYATLYPRVHVGWGYTLACYTSVTLTFELGIISRDVTCVFNSCAKPAVDMTYHSRVKTTTIFK